MAWCPKCRCHYAEPAGEQGEHPCPYCGRFPFERDVDPEYIDEDSYHEQDDE